MAWVIALIRYNKLILFKLDYYKNTKSMNFSFKKKS
jgi:hypothetical protein